MIKRPLCLALAVGTAAVSLGATLGAGTAQAETTVRHGRVIADGLAERSLPSTTGSRLGSLSDGRVIDLTCKVHGRPVFGNDLWYAISGAPTRWVSARYVANVGPAPSYCGTVAEATGRATTTLNQRVAPSTADPKAGTIARGAAVHIVCRTAGRRVFGAKEWYYLTNGHWVSSYYVNGFEGTPRDCA